MLTPPRRRYHKVETLDDHGPIPLTREAHTRMKARLARLKAQLPAFIEDAQLAAADGDRSDNAAYQAAKGALRRTQRQILTLEDQLKRVTEIPDGVREDGTAALGATIVIEKIDNGDAAGDAQKRTYHLVGPFETDPAAGRISHKSPLGAALIGRRENDMVAVRTAHGEVRYRIVSVH